MNSDRNFKNIHLNSVLCVYISVAHSMNNNNFTTEKIAGRGRFNHQTATIKIEDENKHLGNIYWKKTEDSCFCDQNSLHVHNEFGDHLIFSPKFCHHLIFNFSDQKYHMTFIMTTKILWAEFRQKSSWFSDNNPCSGFLVF